MRIRSFDHRRSSCQASAASFSFRLDGALGFDVRVLDELLRDRRTTLDDTLVRDVAPHGTQDAPEVDPLVFPEASILDGDDRLFHDRSNLVGADEHSTLVAPQNREDGSVGGIDVSVSLCLPGFRRVERRNVVRDRGDKPESERGKADQPEDQEEEREAELADTAPRLRRRLVASSQPHEQESVGARSGATRSGGQSLPRSSSGLVGPTQRVQGAKRRAAAGRACREVRRAW